MSSFEDFLAEEGTLAECDAEAQRRVKAWEAFRNSSDWRNYPVENTAKWEAELDKASEFYGWRRRGNPVTSHTPLRNPWGLPSLRAIVGMTITFWVTFAIIIGACLLGCTAPEQPGPAEQLSHSEWVNG
jgi:hypothetical protein